MFRVGARRFKSWETPPLRPEHDFNKYFPFIIPDVLQFFRHELTWYDKCPSVFSKSISLPPSLEKTNQKIEQVLPIWSELKTYSEGRICYHIYKFFYSALRDQECRMLSQYDQNILLWTILLHDVCKKGRPAVTGKDPAHPFRGAWKSLYYFQEPFGWIKLSEKDFAEWDQIFEKGFDWKDGKEVQNHAIIPSVKQFLDKKLDGKNFEKELMYYILLHQSVPMLKDHPHATLLEPAEREIPKYIDKRMFKVFRLILRHDSFSYLLYYSNEMKRTFGKEIDQNLTFIKEYIK